MPTDFGNYLAYLVVHQHHPSPLRAGEWSLQSCLMHSSQTHIPTPALGAPGRDEEDDESKDSDEDEHIREEKKRGGSRGVLGAEAPLHS